MTRLSIILFFLPVIAFSQQPYVAADYDGRLITDTALVYPKYYKDESYQHFIDDSLPDGLWAAYLIDSVTLAFTGHYQNGKPNGLFQYYYKNGKVRHTCVYSNGVYDGPVTYWNENGTLSSIGQYIMGKSEGVFYDWWESGNLKCEVVYRNDNVDGINKWYYPDGQLKWEGHYSQGYEIGEWKFYYNNGKLKKQYFYSDSLATKEIELIERYKNSMSQSYLYFPKSVWKEWDIDGNLIEEQTYNDKFEAEKQIEYYSNGKKKSETYYNGFHLGSCSQYPSYHIKTGTYTEWYDNGKIKVQGVYSDNKKEGEWNYFSEKGKISLKGLYLSDKKEGEWQYYTDKGKLDKTELYKRDILLNTK